jgi:hypothetical protein
LFRREEVTMTTMKRKRRKRRALMVLTDTSPDTEVGYPHRRRRARVAHHSRQARL